MSSPDLQLFAIHTSCGDQMSSQMSPGKLSLDKHACSSSEGLSLSHYRLLYRRLSVTLAKRNQFFILQYETFHKNKEHGITAGSRCGFARRKIS
jgi:hypothetical protein